MEKTPKNDAGKKASEPVTKCDQSNKVVAICDQLNNEVEIMSNLVRDVMENIYQMSVPLKVDIEYGKTWYEAK